MRNKTSFILVLLANLILLAHTVIPHHHHIVASIQLADEFSHEQVHHEKLPFCNGEHKNGETTPCILTEVIIIPNHQIRLSEILELTTTTHTLIFTLSDFNFTPPQHYEDAPNEVVDCIPLYSRFLFSSQGLRAPPVC